GTIATEHSYTDASYAAALLIGDVDGDGDSDLLVANQYSDSFTLFGGEGDGSFAPGVDHRAYAAQDSLGLGDFDGDGALDVLAAIGGTYGGVHLVRGPTFGTRVALFGGDARALRVDDLDGDRRLDFVVASGSVVRLARGKGDGTFEPPVNYTMA